MSIFEMYGKDHSTNTPIYDGICEVLGGRKPNHMSYELFLDDQGQKISKSKGNGLTIDEWLTYASSESLSYFMYQAEDGEADAFRCDPARDG